MVVLNEVDNLTLEGQAGLRRTMEKYMTTCRLILVCNSLSRVIPAVKSRCLCIRIGSPTIPEIANILQDIAQKEKLELNKKFATKIANQSNRNLRRAIMLFEVCKIQNYPFKDNQTIEKPDWEQFIEKIANDIVTLQTPNQLYEIRNKFFELLVHCIPPTDIIRELCTSLIEDKIDISLRFEVIKYAAFYECRIKQGNKPIFHLEAFVAKIMSLQKDYLISRNNNNEKQ